MQKGKRPTLIVEVRATHHRKPFVFVKVAGARVLLVHIKSAGAESLYRVIEEQPADPPPKRCRRNEQHFHFTVFNAQKPFGRTAFAKRNGERAHAPKSL